jgi:uncharacterized protein (TIGR00251 family)
LSGGPPPWLKIREHGVEISIRVVPRSSVDRADGLYGDRLRVRLTAPPVGNAANEALVRLIAKAARIAPSRVRIVLGERGRSKVVFLDEAGDPAGLAERVVAALTSSPV